MSPITSMPMRTAIFARYSTDSQSAQSIDDQIRICRAKAEREGAVGAMAASRPKMTESCKARSMSGRV